MRDITINIKGTSSVEVSENNLAVTMESGSLKVFATPAMVALMEKASCSCLSDYLDNGETTVGTEMNIKHTSATPQGMTVTAEAVLKSVNGREFTFEVTAYDTHGEIGKGTHKRFLVYAEKFTEKTYKKLSAE
ncbi:MAG: thioesterase family protein [Ruminococcus sp.]|nr:thioesterase family protein [Ruminococcus sp.]